jgi:hypothetical protein
VGFGGKCWAHCDESGLEKARPHNSAQLGLAKPEIAEAEGEPAIGIKLGQKPGALRIRDEEFHDGLEVEGVFPVVNRGALRGRWRGVVRRVL